MSELDSELKRDIECLRLAADFMQLSDAALNPELRDHCIRMAKYWSDQATGEPKSGLAASAGSGYLR